MANVVGSLFRHAVHQEQCGDTKLFDAILRFANRAVDERESRIVLRNLSASGMCIYASPRATVLAGPYIHWGERSVDAQGLVSKWLATISVAPHTEEVIGSVVDTLFRIAANRNLRPSIPAGVWLWLNKRPSLPPARRVLLSGSHRDIVQTVRALKDIGILTSYLIIVWSEWKPLDHVEFAEMEMSVREDFKGIGMGCHRTELIQQLDYILGELDWHLDVNLEDDWLWHREVGGHSRVMKDEYGQLKRILEEVDREATEILNRMPHNFISLRLLTLTDLHRTPLHLHVCPASPVSITSHSERLALFPANPFVHPLSILSFFPLAFCP
jgi:hypothetical protein